jgi:RNA polymerase sigma factor (sigma-70 family)
MADVSLRTVIRRLANLVSARQLGGLNDAVLRQRFVSLRDEAAFEVLVWRHGMMVLGVCERVLRHSSDAEDAFQATFLSLAREARSIGQGQAMGGWLHRVAFRTALKRKASAARQIRLERRVPVEAAVAPAEDLIWQDLRTVLDEEINQLPDKYREPFVLCYLEGKTNTEAARQIGCPPGTVATRLAWAREHLRNRLTRRGLTLTLAALAAALGAEAARSAPPSILVEATLRAALSNCSGCGPATGAGNGKTTLMKGLVKAMLLTRVKVLVFVVIAVGLLAAGVSIFSHGAFSGNPEPGQTREEPPKPAPETPKPVAPGDPRVVLGQSLAAAEAVKEDPQKLHILVAIALAQDQAGDRTGGLKTLDQALSVAIRLANDPTLTMALHWLVKAQVQLGDNKGLLRAVALVGDERQKNHIRFLIVGEEAEAGEVAEAMKTAESITDDQKDSALAAVAGAQARKGDIKAALVLADQLKHQPLSRATALEAIALAQAKAGEKTAAATNLEEALRLEAATLAGEVARSRARARLAISQAQTGDLASALQTAAGLHVEEDKRQALQGIAVEQVNAGDLKSALKTIEGINGTEKKAHALLVVAGAQVSAGKREATRETLQAAQRVADSLPDNVEKQAWRWDHARMAIRAGDVRPALALVQAQPESENCAWTLLEIAEAHAAAGDRAAAASTLKQAWEAASTLKEADNPVEYQTLAPRWVIMKGQLLRQIAAGLVQAGGEGNALTRAGKEELPFLKALALIGAAEGMVARKKPVGEAKPSPPE